MPYSIITKTGSYIPTERIPNSYFNTNIFYGADGKQVEKSTAETVNKLSEITGINERRYASGELITSDIAFFAAEMALETIDKETLDYIIFAHNYGDIRSNNIRTDICPALAARVKHKLRIENPNTVAYDIIFGCPGWIHGLVLADNHIKLGQAKRVLVIGADILSRVCDPHDMDSMIYADGAGATLIEATEQEAGILSNVTRTDSFNEAYLFHMGKSYNPDYQGTELCNKMDGRALYQYTADTVPIVVKQSLDKAGISIMDVKKILIHQANEKMDEAILKNLFRLYQIKDIPKDIMPMTISWLGNSSVATIPTMLDLIHRGTLNNHQLHPGDVIVFASVGAGMHINSIVYRIPEQGTIINNKVFVSGSHKTPPLQTAVKKVLSEDPSMRLKYLEEYLHEQVNIALSKLDSLKDLKISATDRLIELDFDSLSAIDLQTNINHDFGIKIPFAILFGNSTIHELAIILHEHVLSVHCNEETTPNESEQQCEEKWTEGEI